MNTIFIIPAKLKVYNCLNQILKVLKDAGVDIDISEAKIRELEINNYS